LYNTPDPRGHEVAVSGSVTVTVFLSEVRVAVVVAVVVLRR
jgi:hypothetical protein